ncbi:hypothetical protein L207DRAFT_54997 [Hyaloscypha variabilis F]|uniref:Uncharacterized protein n=1 Tax=Hyaloscypha variabilis (strain UAMH 11265 / GT02V1 / F) TaxID=1149755 RepID=A0A2J6RL07_HYAVF|nr:hypothetical protein L207DRAFT_54997 [Hyaloscypha variabilis F]
MIHRLWNYNDEEISFSGTRVLNPTPHSEKPQCIYPLPENSSVSITTGKLEKAGLLLQPYSGRGRLAPWGFCQSPPAGWFCWKKAGLKCGCMPWKPPASACH